jgi:hypothetical protein
MTFNDFDERIATLAARVGSLEARMVEHDRRHRQHRNDIDGLYDGLPRTGGRQANLRVTEWVRPLSRRYGSLECPNCGSSVSTSEIRQQVLSGGSPTCVNPVCGHPVDLATVTRLRHCG